MGKKTKKIHSSIKPIKTQKNRWVGLFKKRFFKPWSFSSRSITAFIVSWRIWPSVLTESLQTIKVSELLATIFGAKLATLRNRPDWDLYYSVTSCLLKWAPAHCPGKNYGKWRVSAVTRESEYLMVVKFEMPVLLRKQLQESPGWFCRERHTIKASAY